MNTACSQRESEVWHVFFLKAALQGCCHAQPQAWQEYLGLQEFDKPGQSSYQLKFHPGLSSPSILSNPGLPYLVYHYSIQV
jgi:hypothetical protein